jgi:hypothetical protein
MNADKIQTKIERVAIQEAKALLKTLDLLADEFHLDSDGHALAGELQRWLSHIQ